MVMTPKRSCGISEFEMSIIRLSLLDNAASSLINRAYSDGRIVRDLAYSTSDPQAVRSPGIAFESSEARNSEGIPIALDKLPSAQCSSRTDEVIE